MNTQGMDSEARRPNHVVLLISGNGISCRSTKVRMRQDTDILLKNIFEIANQFGVRFLTFCCLDDAEKDCSPTIGNELKILFSLLSIGRDWLQNNNIKMRSIDMHKKYNIDDLGKLQLSVISQLDGRDAITTGVQKLVAKIEQGEVSVGELTTQMIDKNISSFGLPDPDLIIFSGGLKRLNNSFIWQSAYSEFAFMEEHWQDLSPQQYWKVLEDYMARDRRFGGLKEEKKSREAVG